MKIYILPFILFAFTSCGDGANENTDNAESNAAVENSENTTDDKAEADGPFSIKSGIIEYEMKKLNGEVKARLKFYFSKYGNLMKLEETADGETSIYIYNEATKKGVTQFPGRTPSKIFMRQGELNTLVAQRGTNGFTQQADEVILGKNCEVQANNATTAEGDPKVKFWLHKGIAMKEINRLGMGYEFEAVKFDEKPVDKSLFSLPGGEMPHDIF